MTIVVGYIPSPEGETALTQAIAEAANRNASLVVVNSSKGDTPIDDHLIDAREYHQLEERLTQAGITFRIIRTPQGADPADEILNAARAQSAELIVIGLRKRTPMGKFIMGSTAQRVILQAGCPVLSLKAEDGW